MDRWSREICKMLMAISMSWINVSNEPGGVQWISETLMVTASSAISRMSGIFETVILARKLRSRLLEAAVMTSGNTTSSVNRCRPVLDGSPVGRSERVAAYVLVEISTGSKISKARWYEWIARAKVWCAVSKNRCWCVEIIEWEWSSIMNMRRNNSCIQQKRIIFRERVTGIEGIS